MNGPNSVKPYSLTTYSMITNLRPTCKDRKLGSGTIILGMLLLQRGRSVSSVARELKVNYSQVVRWPGRYKGMTQEQIKKILETP